LPGIANITVPKGVVLNDVQFAGVSTSTIKCGDDALIVDGGATSTLTNSFENCTQIRPNVAIQTAGGTSSIYTTHICLKTCFVRDRTGTIRPLVVNVCIVPALRHDLLSVKGLNKSEYRAIHDEDEMESGIYAVINRKIDTAKSIAFMSEHSTLFYLKIVQMNAQQFEKQSGLNYGIGEWRTPCIRIFVNQFLVHQEWNP
jgi:hypothetical protein